MPSSSISPLPLTLPLFHLHNNHHQTTPSHSISMHFPPDINSTVPPAITTTVVSIFVLLTQIWSIFLLLSLSHVCSLSHSWWLFSSPLHVSLSMFTTPLKCRLLLIPVRTMVMMDWSMVSRFLRKLVIGFWSSLRNWASVKEMRILEKLKACLISEATKGETKGVGVGGWWWLW